MDNNEKVSPASEEFEALLPEGWTGEGDFFDESTCAENCPSNITSTSSAKMLSFVRKIF